MAEAADSANAGISVLAASTKPSGSTTIFAPTGAFRLATRSLSNSRFAASSFVLPPISTVTRTAGASTRPNFSPPSEAKEKPPARTATQPSSAHRKDSAPVLRSAALTATAPSISRSPIFSFGASWRPAANAERRVRSPTADRPMDFKR